MTTKDQSGRQSGQQKDRSRGNVVNLGDARKRFVNGASRGSLSGPNQRRRSKKNPSKKLSQNSRSWLSYVQFILLLAIVAYAMQLCQR